ncbi:hypothetical protein [Xylella fastidiosa]|nr:hypothetical protein [Xylella fastidiosa]
MPPPSPVVPRRRPHATARTVVPSINRRKPVSCIKAAATATA